MEDCAESSLDIPFISLKTNIRKLEYSTSAPSSSSGVELKRSKWSSEILTTYVQALLFGVGRLDVTAFAGMSAVMLAVAFVASYIPARRASRVDPMLALRSER